MNVKMTRSERESSRWRGRWKELREGESGVESSAAQSRRHFTFHPLKPTKLPPGLLVPVNFTCSPRLETPEWRLSSPDRPTHRSHHERKGPDWTGQVGSQHNYPKLQSSIARNNPQVMRIPHQAVPSLSGTSYGDTPQRPTSGFPTRSTLIEDFPKSHQFKGPKHFFNNTRTKFSDTRPESIDAAGHCGLHPLHLR